MSTIFPLETTITSCVEKTGED